MMLFNTDKKTYISGTCGKERFNIPYNETKYIEMQKVAGYFSIEAEKDEPDWLVLKKWKAEFKKLIKQDYNAIIADECEYLVYNPAKRSFYLQLDGVVNKKPLPKDAVDYLKELHGNGVGVLPYVRMLQRFYINPYYSDARVSKLINRLRDTYVDVDEAETVAKEQGVTMETALEMCTYPDVQITAQGLIVMYKVVKEILTKYTKNEDGNVVRVPRYKTEEIVDEDTGEISKTTNYPKFLEDRVFEPAIFSTGEDFYCGDKLGYVYRVGQVHTLPSWKSVDMDESSSHKGGGFYCGSLRYVKHYFHEGREVMQLFVCPSMLGKFTDDGIGEITCKSFMLFDSLTVAADTKGIYHSSKYSNYVAKELDAKIKAKFEKTKADLDERASKGAIMNSLQ